MRIFIEDLQNKIEVTNKMKAIIEKAIEHSLSNEKFEKECEVGVTLVDNERIHEINKEYRSIDKPTDVLSFPLIDFNKENDDPFDYDEGYLMLGDIIISIEKAADQAEEYGHSIEREVGYLCVHSVLHLLGYDHENEDERKIMRGKEEEILSGINLTRYAT